MKPAVHVHVYVLACIHVYTCMGHLPSLSTGGAVWCWLSVEDRLTTAEQGFSTITNAGIADVSSAVDPVGGPLVETFSTSPVAGTIWKSVG